MIYPIRHERNPMMKALDFLTTYWPALLALGAFTTALNQLVQKVASNLAPRWPWVARIANMVNTISVDYAKLLAELGGAVNVGPRAKDKGPKDPPAGGAVVGLVFALAMALPGCSSFMHFQDKTLDDGVGDLCSTLAIQERPRLEAEAKRQGISFNVIQDIFEAACALRVKQGLSPARAAGMAAARHEVAP